MVKIASVLCVFFMLFSGTNRVIVTLRDPLGEHHVFMDSIPILIDDKIRCFHGDTIYLNDGVHTFKPYPQKRFWAESFLDSLHIAQDCKIALKVYPID